MTSTINELGPQASFLGMAHGKYQEICLSGESLKNYMIRHTKAQSIGGSAALALPQSTTTIQYIRMSATEKTAYDAIRNIRQRSLAAMKQRREAEWMALRHQVLWALTNPLIRADSSKMKALEATLLSLRSQDPNMRVVVFSQLRDVMCHVQACVQRLGIPLYYFDGSTTAKKRDENIRAFQSTARTGPAVFGMTLATGSVGITLTAASHGT